MGCLKLIYHEDTERSNFLSVWKKSDALEKSTNYQSWGGVLREQKWIDLDAKYRYGYQGQFSEHDDETNWNHFEARELDPVIGRWTSTDPSGQYWSLYMAMGNNPVSSVDPDGRDDIYYRRGREYSRIGNDQPDRFFKQFRNKEYTSGFETQEIFRPPSFFNYFNSFGSQLRNDNFFHGMMNSLGSNEAKSALFSARLANKDSKILYGTLAIPALIIGGGELAAAAPSLVSGASQLYNGALSGANSLTMLATEINSAGSVIVTNGLRNLAYNSAVTLRPLAFSGGAIVGDIAIKAHNGLMRLSGKLKIDLYKDIKRGYDTYKQIDKIADP